MILPAKHIPVERSIVGIGAEVLMQLKSPLSVSEAWSKVKQVHDQKRKPITFDWFVATLTWLYAISAIEISNGVLIRHDSQ